MGGKTSIEWTEMRWNFLRGCSRVSDGCTRCYAEKIAARFSDPGQPFHKIAVRRPFKGDQRSNWTGEISFHEDILLEPLRWKKPRRVFVNSMSDLFHEKVTDEMLDKAFAVMALTPQHTYQILTKRPERMKEYLREDNLIRWGLIEGNAQRIHFERTGEDPSEWLAVHGPLPNVWLGVSVEDQKTADERIPLLLQTPAAIRWISAEPLLGPIDLSLHQVDGVSVDATCDECGERHAGACEDGLDWVVVGGESGPGARPCDIANIRSIIAQCKTADIPVFVKQLGASPFEPARYQIVGDSGLYLNNRKGGDIEEWPEYLRVREFPKV